MKGPIGQVRQRNIECGVLKIEFLAFLIISMFLFLRCHAWNLFGACIG